MSYLLGMHQQFLSDDPQEIVDTWQMVQATLPHKFDPRGLALNEATLDAYLQKEHSRIERLIDNLDRHASRVVYQFLVGKKTAEQMQAAPKPLDWVAAASLGLPLTAKYAGMWALRRVPGMSDRVDRYATREIRSQLQLNVNPVAFKTDVKNYKQAL